MSKAAPAPYATVDVGCHSGNFHTYILDKDGRKIGVVWGPTEEKVWTAALFAASPELLAACERALLHAPLIRLSSERQHVIEVLRAAIAKATGAAS